MRNPWSSCSLSFDGNPEMGTDGGSILATFFNTGELVRIARDDGTVEVILSDLSHPHSIRRLPATSHSEACYCFSDSTNARVVCLNESLAVVAEYPAPHAWIQDAAFCRDGALLLAANRNIRERAAGDDNHIIKMDPETGHEIGRLTLGPDSHLYKITPIDAETAEVRSFLKQGRNLNAEATFVVELV